MQLAEWCAEYDAANSDQRDAEVGAILLQNAFAARWYTRRPCRRPWGQYTLTAPDGREVDVRARHYPPGAAEVGVSCGNFTDAWSTQCKTEESVEETGRRCADELRRTVSQPQDRRWAEDVAAILACLN